MYHTYVSYLLSVLIEFLVLSLHLLCYHTSETSDLILDYSLFLLYSVFLSFSLSLSFSFSLLNPKHR